MLTAGLLAWTSRPRSRFVAEFVGQCNFLTGAVGTGPDGDAVLTTAEFSEGIAVQGRHDGPRGTIAVRPEDIEISSGVQLDAPGAGTEASVLRGAYLGDHYHYQVAVGTVQLSVHSQRPLAPGPVRLRIPPGVATFVD